MSFTSLTRIGALLADETRSQFLAVLMDGRARTGGELARHARVAPSTASEHLSRLLDAGLVAVEAQGRHRYFRLAGPEVAEMLEALGAVAIPDGGVPGPRAPAALVHARSCYDHLAGALAVRIFDGLLAQGHLAFAGPDLAVTASGDALLAGFGIDMEAIRGASRPVARSCLDWTERRHHLAGGAGAALFDALLERRWIARGGPPRSIVVSDAGRRGLEALLA